MDVYKIGVSIVLTNSILPALTAMSAQFMGMNNTVTLLNRNLGALKQVGLGVAAVMGGKMIFEGMAKLAEHGSAVNHQLELMKIAGMSNSEIQDGMGAAMKTTGTNLTTHLSENLAHVKELRYAFGDVGVAIQHLDEISKSNSVLNAIKGGGGDQVWELVKSLEQKGLTFDPATFSSYVNTMTKVVEATGGKVTPADFMSTFKYGRTAMLGWDEDFVGGALPRLMQSMKGGGGSGAGGPGNALMSAFAKVVQGQMPKNAAEEFERMGLTPGGISHIKGSSQTQITGGIAGRDQFIANPYEWVQQTLMPALAAHGVTSQNDIISQISKMFPVRTAGQVMTEYGLQGRFHEGANSPIEKDMHQQRGAMGIGGFNELIKNDYPTVMKAFHTQFKNLLEVLGSPLVAPGGPVLRAMNGLASAMSSMASFAGANPTGVKIALEAIAAVGTALVIGGLVALGTAIAGLIGVGGIVVGLVAAFGALVAFNWDSVKEIGTKILDALKAIAPFVIGGLPGIFVGIGAAILSALKNAVMGAIGGLGGGGGHTGGASGGWDAPSAKKMNYWSAPPGGGNRGTIQIINRIDGPGISRGVIKTVVRDAQAIHGSVDHDGVGGAPHPASFRI